MLKSPVPGGHRAQQMTARIQFVLTSPVSEAHNLSQVPARVELMLTSSLPSNRYAATDPALRPANCFGLGLIDLTYATCLPATGKDQVHILTGLTESMHLLLAVGKFKKRKSVLSITIKKYSRESRF
jgi:hypothetical protein